MFETYREWVKKFPERLNLTQIARGVYTGQLEQALTKTAAYIGSAIPSGRATRLRFASDVLGREIKSFNDLSDAEIWAFNQYTSTDKRAAFQEIQQWLADTYGKQEKLI